MTYSWILTGLLGAAALLPLELACLRGLSAALCGTVTSLLLLAGLICGAVLGVQESVVARLSLRPLLASAVRATGAVLPLALVARTLFDGGFASTLAIAPSAPYWLPIGGYLALTLGLLAVRPLGKTPRRRLVASGLLGAILFIAELADRTLYVSEYADVHAFLVLVSVVLATVALRLLAEGLWPGPVRAPLRPLGALAGTMVLCTGCALGLQYGLHDQQVRWSIATSRTHSRHIARVMRAATARAEEPAVVEGEAEEPSRGAAATGEPPPTSCSGPGCAGGQPGKEWAESAPVKELLARTRGHNVLLLSVDALRADVLSGPDSERDMPFMTTLLRSSRQFRHAFAPSAGTDLSLASLLTGSINPFVSIEQTLPEALVASGRATHAVLPSEVLRWVGQTLLTRGLQSFDRVITDPGQEDIGRNTTSAATTDLGLAFLDQRAGEAAERPFFLWLHYFDVHEHDQIEKDDPALQELLGGRPRGRAQKYRALAQIVDRQIGRVLVGLKDRGLLDNTVVVLFSDHGESLGEDPRFPENHGHYVYNALVHVPLALRVPGVEPAVIDDPVSLIDLMPTVVALSGGAVPAALDAVSLLPYLVGPPPPASMARALVINESEQYAVLQWPHKLLVRPAEHLVELYDLESDFQERRDLSGNQGHRVRELKRLYRRFPRVQMDRSARGRQLRELAAQPPARP